MNSVHLVGRVGQDPDIRTTQNGGVVANFSLATTEYFTNDDGKRDQRTEWHSIVCWNRVAELAEKYIHKGDLLGIEGKLQMQEWTDHSGKKSKVKVNVFRLHFLSSKNAGSAPRQEEEHPF